MILLLRWKHHHEEQRASFLDGSKHMQVDFSCLMTMVMMMMMMMKMKWSCPFSQGSSLVHLSCVHSEATCCIDSFTKDWHSDDTHMRILIQNGQKKMETHSVLLCATLCYLSISSILWKQRGNKASNQSPELPRQTRMVENFNTMRHNELGTESGRSFGTPRSVKCKLTGSDVSELSL